MKQQDILSVSSKNDSVDDNESTHLEDDEEYFKQKFEAFWKSTPGQYASEQTKNLDEKSKLSAYPAAHLFRSIFTRKFWMFVLVGLIIFISFKTILVNDVQ